MQVYCKDCFSEPFYCRRQIFYFWNESLHWYFRCCQGHYQVNAKSSTSFSKPRASCWWPFCPSSLCLWLPQEPLNSFVVISARYTNWLPSQELFMEAFPEQAENFQDGSVVEASSLLSSERVKLVKCQQVIQAVWLQVFTVTYVWDYFFWWIHCLLKARLIKSSSFPVLLFYEAKDFVLSILVPQVKCVVSMPHARMFCSEIFSSRHPTHHRAGTVQ